MQDLHVLNSTSFCIRLMKKRAKDERRRRKGRIFFSPKRGSPQLAGAGIDDPSLETGRKV